MGGRGEYAPTATYIGAIAGQTLCEHTVLLAESGASVNSCRAMSGRILVRCAVKIFMTKLRLVNFLSQSVTWSALSSIGQSPVVRLTILVPFVGYLLIFNSHVQDIFTISLQHVIEITGTNNESEIQQELFTLNRLNFAYFGLVLIGLASTLFALFAPQEVRLHSLPADYIIHIESIATKNLARTALERVLAAYMRMESEEHRHPMSSLTSRSFPAVASQRLHSLIKQAFESTESAVDDQGAEIPFDNEFIAEFYTGTGHLRTDVIIEKLYSERRVDAAAIAPVFDEILKHFKDIFYLEHLSLNHSHFWIRASVATLYAGGFTLLFIPTAQTTWRLALSWLWA